MKVLIDALNNPERFKISYNPDPTHPNPNNPMVNLFLIIFFLGQMPVEYQ